MWEDTEVAVTEAVVVTDVVAVAVHGVVMEAEATTIVEVAEEVGTHGVETTTEEEAVETHGGETITMEEEEEAHGVEAVEGAEAMTKTSVLAE